MVQGDFIITEYCKRNLKNLGFKFDWNWELVFPVLFWKRIPILYCKIEITEDKEYVWHNVIDQSGRMYAPYYQQLTGQYGDYLKKIDSLIQKKFKQLGIIVKKKKRGSKIGHKNQISKKYRTAYTSPCE